MSDEMHELSDDELEQRALGFGRRLREARNERGWSMDRLAIEAKVTKSAIYALEANRNQQPQPKTLRKLASALGMSPEELLYDVKPPDVLRAMGVRRLLYEATNLNQRGVEQALLQIEMLQQRPEFVRNGPPSGES